MVKGLTIEHVCTTPGHTQQYMDRLWEGRESIQMEVGKRRKNGNNYNSINNKNKKKIKTTPPSKKQPGPLYSVSPNKFTYF